MLQFLPSTANLGGINNTCASLSIEIRCFHITFQLSPTSWNVFTLTTTLKLNQLLDICIKACYLTNLYRSIHTNIPMFLSHKFSVSISHEFNSILITHYQETWFPLCLCILFVISLKNPFFEKKSKDVTNCKRGSLTQNELLHQRNSGSGGVGSRGTRGMWILSVDCTRHFAARSPMLSCLWPSANLGQDADDPGLAASETFSWAFL